MVEKIRVSNELHAFQALGAKIVDDATCYV